MSDRTFLAFVVGYVVICGVLVWGAYEQGYANGTESLKPQLVDQELEIAAWRIAHKEARERIAVLNGKVAEANAARGQTVGPPPDLYSLEFAHETP